MMIGLKFWRLSGASLVFLAFAAVGVALAGSAPRYVVTNDDVLQPFPSDLSFYSMAADGRLSLKEQVYTNAFGSGGGYFATNRLAVLDNANTHCVYSSNAGSAQIVGIDVDTLQLGNAATGSPTDTGVSNGIGLAVNSQYLYAAFTDVSTIGTFQVQAGCGLTFINDVTVGGLQGGIIAAMALRGSTLVATYGDGSIESFNISNGTPVSNGDRQNSPAYAKSQGSTYPNGIDITRDGRYVLFGDTSTSSVVEVSDISSGKLTTPVSYTFNRTINSSNILLSPDETLLYISDTQGDTVSAVFFDAVTGKLSPGCISGKLRNYGSTWSYLASLSLQSTTGTGGVLYVAEFGSPSSIAMIQVASSGGKCTLTEMPDSPVAADSTALLSIQTFPPRPF
jgi:6-phosphogluconolactonase (cycloisomerase 2 family)